MQRWRGVKKIVEEFEGKPVWAVEFSSVGSMLMVSFGDSESQKTIMFKESGGGEFAQILDFDENGFNN